MTGLLRATVFSIISTLTSPDSGITVPIHRTNGGSRALERANIEFASKGNDGNGTKESCGSNGATYNNCTVAARRERRGWRSLGGKGRCGRVLFLQRGLR
ncbi:hypothetical protein EDD16DRAFT_1546052 [Pisolithus croceorrhizus]|nr:hypothetical protein EDD16DRAFT_1546052 [Pisolithus croceorrhizus]